MKILIIGNGFDLAHSLPTGYKHFLCYVEEYKRYYVNGNKAIEPPSDKAKALKTALNLNEIIEHEFYGLIEKNVWLDYFFKRQTLLGDTWIDCESEIKYIIGLFEDTYIQYGIIHIDPTPVPIFLFFDGFRKSVEHLDVIPNSDCIIQGNDIFNFIDYLFKQLREFTRIFEIYCDCFVNRLVGDYAVKHDLQNLSLQASVSDRIKNGRIERNRTYNLIKEEENLDIIKEEYETLVPLRMFDFDCVLSFNYTKTFELLYGHKITKYCYIHGKAQSVKNKTDMIFGIDDTLENREEENSQFAFANFKKYFQRIFYKTGSEYRDWIREMQNPDDNSVHEIHIFGHSLGRTDHEIFKEFFNINRNSFENGMVIVTIYYHDRKSNINVIEKVIEMIHKPALIERVHGENWTIGFKYQHDEESKIIKSDFFKVESGELKKV